MNSLSQQQVRLIEGLLLGVILVFAYFMASSPHWHYPYPIHSDEWTHYSHAQNLMETGRIDYPDSFDSGAIFSPDIEIGFHLLIGELKLITGISWLNLFRFLPGIILAVLVFQAYAFARERGSGLGVAFLVALIPTTIRFLGPAFLVPIALGLIFIPLTLFTLHRFMSDLKGPIILFMLFVALLFIHPPTFLVVSAIAMVYLIIFLLPRQKPQGNTRQLVLALVSFIPIYTFIFFWAPSFVDFAITEAMSPQLHLPLPPIWDAVSKFGFISAALFALGVGIFAYQGKRCHWVILLPAIGLLAFQLIYPRLYIGPDIIYERGWLYLYVLMALIAGFTLGELWKWVRGGLRHKPAMATAVSYTIIGILVASAFTLSLRGLLDEPYYHLVDDATYQDFLWIREHVPAQYQIGIVDSGKACPFSAITGKYSYTSETAPDRYVKYPFVEKFFQGRAGDTQWLVEEGIGIVYTPGVVENSELIEVNRNLYLLTKEKGDL